MNELKRVCYIRPENEIPVNYITSAKLCTHIIVGFASVKDGVIEVDDTNHEFYIRCKTSIIEANVETLLMISIGGGGNDNGFHFAALNDINRKAFANSALEVMIRYGLNGLDLDWEFPGWANTHHNDKHNFNLLLKEIRQTFNAFSKVNPSRAPLVLSAAVAAQYTIIHRSYSVSELIENVDFINLMSYDYYLHHWYWPFVGHNSPLFSQSLGMLSTLSTEWSANYWQRLGAPKSKIIVGIPTYGRSFQLALSWLTAPGSLALSASQDMTYSQICRFLRSDETTVVFDPKSQVHFAYRGYQWITYESRESAVNKVDWIERNGFGGVMTFSLNADDFRHECNHNQLFAIQSAIKAKSLNP